MRSEEDKIFNYEWVKNPENQCKNDDYVFESLGETSNNVVTNSLIQDVDNDEGDNESFCDLTQDIDNDEGDHESFCNLT
ncbi:319_t:CDS:2 [Cetraspora pellucida]|uniref:319_t:CDS:1 n=1 Tax=Cetraspora pellucida TaxID=1433469 RepID=A0A9N8ZGT3_9GLOM|nr:319_t:CDS:2 [Cetraspora pellucida]